MAGGPCAYLTKSRLLTHARRPAHVARHPRTTRTAPWAKIGMTCCSGRRGHPGDDGLLDQLKATGFDSVEVPVFAIDDPPPTNGWANGSRALA